MSGDAAGRPAGPDQLEWREQPPALVAPQDAARHQKPGHRRGAEALPAKTTCHPQPLAQLPDLRHAVHGSADGAAEHIRYCDLAEPRKHRVDAALDARGKAFWSRIPRRLRACPHQAIAIDNTEMIDAVAVHHRSPKRNGFGEPLAERFGDGAVAPDRQQRFRQPLQRRAEMDVAGEHDMRGAQPRRRRDDALANAGRIDADDRRILKDAHPCPPRQRRQAVDIFAAVDLKRPGIMDAVKITPGSELIAHAIDLPAFHLGFKILTERLQPADQRLTDVDIADFQRAFAQGDAGHCLFGRGGANVIGALLRQRPEFLRIFQSDPPTPSAPSRSAAFQPTCRPSSTAMLAPIRAASSATVSPASPAPTIQMSTSRSKDRRVRIGGVPASGPLVVLVEVSLMSFSYGP